ncbi:MAG: site-specific integrase [Chloroflexota bacterium]
MKTLEVLENVLKGKRISPSTQKLYRMALGSLVKYTEEWPMDAKTINEWITQLTGYADETVETFFQYANSAGNYMRKVMGRNPDGSYRWFNAFVDAERPKVRKKQRRYFSAEEMLNCLKACRGEVEIALVSTLIDSSCRIGELVGLLGRDVYDNFFVCRQGKTGQRHYRLDSRICRQLKKMAGGDDNVVFKMYDGVTPANVWRLTGVVRRVIKRAGITGKKVGPHTLRHSGASLIARKTQSALVVKALLQHDKIETSMLYIHDVETEIQQSISPMAMIQVKPVEPEQLMITGSEVIEAEVDNVVEEVDLISEMFPMIPDGTEVRPLLKTTDLRMLREVFVSYSRVYRGDSKVYGGQELLQRMLRKVKLVKLVNPLAAGTVKQSGLTSGEAGQ